MSRTENRSGASSPSLTVHAPLSEHQPKARLGCSGLGHLYRKGRSWPYSLGHGSLWKRIQSRVPLGARERRPGLSERASPWNSTFLRSALCDPNEVGGRFLFVKDTHFSHYPTRPKGVTYSLQLKCHYFPSSSSQIEALVESFGFCAASFCFALFLPIRPKSFPIPQEG